jgi:hypothetical protein
VSGKAPTASERSGERTLRGDELLKTAGTLGEPLRVVSLLPGVTTGLSGVGYPVIRGALPGDSLFSIDGVAVPMLYHLFLGTSVTHPRFISDIVFEPGGFPASIGRYSGGRVAAEVAPAPDESQTELSVSLVELGAYHARPLGDRSSFAGGLRAGSLGLLLKAFVPELDLNYFDWQSRLQLHRGATTLSVTQFGALDIVRVQDGDDQGQVDIGFQRLLLRSHSDLGSGATLVAGVELHYDRVRFSSRDRSNSPDEEDFTGNLFGGRPHLELRLQPTPWLELVAGGDLLGRWTDLTTLEVDDDDDGDDGDPEDDLRFPDTELVAGLFLMGNLRLGRFSATPGVRGDVYWFQVRDPQDAATPPSYRHHNLDPRLKLSYQLGPALLLHAGAGIYSSPPRVTLVAPPLVVGPLPVTEGLTSAFRANRVRQYQLGFDARLSEEHELQASGFYHDMDLSFDFGLFNRDIDGAERAPCETSVEPSNDPLFPLDITGRAYGLELMLRRRLHNRISGWLAYTLSRSEREHPGFPERGRFPTDFDQTHVFNAALNWRASRHWTLGAVVHHHTGSPVTPYEVARCADYYDSVKGPINSARLPGFTRLDLRIERSYHFAGWQLDVFLDFLNVLLRPEPIALEQPDEFGRVQTDTLRLFLPLLGVSARF